MAGLSFFKRKIALCRYCLSGRLAVKQDVGLALLLCVTVDVRVEAADKKAGVQIEKAGPGLLS